MLRICFSDPPYSGPTLLLMISSTHPTCGLLCTVSVWRGVRSYLNKFSGCYCKIEDNNSGGKAARATHHNFILFFMILARKMSILGLSTELGDRIFQSIIVGVRMKTCRCCVDCRSEYTSRHETHASLA